MISSGDELPNPSFVVRYVGYSRMATDCDGVVTGPKYSAFEQTSKEDYLSVAWCEFFDGAPETALRCAIEAVRNSKIDVKSQACFCVANTEDLRNAATKYGGGGRAVFWPEEDNPAHAGIYGFSPENIILLEFLATDTWSTFYTKQSADILPLSACKKASNVA